MTGSNLIALAPWIIFGAALAAVCPVARLPPRLRPPGGAAADLFLEQADRGSAEAAPQRAGQPPAATSTGVGHHEQLRRDHGRRAGRSGLVRRGRSARPGVP